MIGAWDKDGNVVVGCSGPGKCAEDDAADQLEGPPSGFVNPVDADGEVVPVCVRCQPKFPQKLFPDRQPWVGSGNRPWGGFQK